MLTNILKRAAVVVMDQIDANVMDKRDAELVKEKILAEIGKTYKVDMTKILNTQYDPNAPLWARGWRPLLGYIYGFTVLYKFVLRDLIDVYLAARNKRPK